MSPSLSSPLPDYAELHCVSNFTFLQGASHPEELVERAFNLGYASLAITDECSLSGVVRAHIEAKKYALHLLIGCEVTLICGTKLVVLATNRNGYGNLSQLITNGRRRADKGTYQLGMNDFIDSDGIGLLDCLAILIPHRDQSTEQHQQQCQWLARTFVNRGWIGVELLHRLDDDLWLQQMTELSNAHALPLVACGDVVMHVRSRKPLQDTLTAIRIGKPVAECGLALHVFLSERFETLFRENLLSPGNVY